MLFDLLARPDDTTLSAFATLWHGPPASHRSGEVPDGPAALRAFHEHRLRWPALLRHNQLPVVLERVDGGRVVFMVENQGVDLWATTAAGDDPSVWSKPNEPGEWELEGEPLSPFLVQVAIFEAVLAARIGATAAWLPRSEAELALASLDELPLAPWRRPTFPTRFYAGDRSLALMLPNPGPEDEEYASVFVAGLDDASVAFLSDVVDERWEHVQLRATP